MYILDSLKNKLTLESSLYSRKSNTSIEELEGYYLEKFDGIFEVTARRKPEEDSLSTINKSINTKNYKRIYYLDEKSSDTIIFNMDHYFEITKDTPTNVQLYIDFDRLINDSKFKEIHRVLIKGNLNIFNFGLGVFDLSKPNKGLDYPNNKKIFILEYEDFPGGSNGNFINLKNIYNIGPNIEIININTSINGRHNLEKEGSFIQLKDPTSSIISKGIRLLNIEDLLFEKNEQKILKRLDPKLLTSYVSLSEILDNQKVIDIIITKKGGKLLRNGNPYTTNFWSKEEVMIWVSPDGVKKGELNTYIKNYSRFYKNYKILEDSKGMSHKYGKLLYFYD